MDSLVAVAVGLGAAFLLVRGAHGQAVDLGVSLDQHRRPEVRSPVLIYGDSQVDGFGRGLATALEDRGLSVTRAAHPGRGTQWLARNAPSVAGYASVIILSGSNDAHDNGYDADAPAAAARLVQAVRQAGASAIYVPALPLSDVTDFGRFRAVWGRSTDDPAYWFNRASGGFAANYDRVRREIARAAQRQGASILTLDRTTGSDGLHASRADGARAAEALR